MNLTDKDQLLEFPSLLARVFKESALIVIIGVCLFLILALLGYDPRDPGWSHLGYQPEVRNYTGKVGAWLADLSLSAVGIAAYLIPVVICVPAVRFLVRKNVSLMDAVPYFILRSVGALLLLACAAAIASTHFDNREMQLPFSAGGLLGEALSDQFVDLFSVVGSSVLLFTLFLFGCTLFIEASWGRVLEFIGKGVVNGVEKARERSSALAARRGENADYEAYEEYDEHDEDCTDDVRAEAEVPVHQPSDSPPVTMSGAVAEDDPLLSAHRSAAIERQESKRIEPSFGAMDKASAPNETPKHQAAQVRQPVREAVAVVEDDVPFDPSPNSQPEYIQPVQERAPVQEVATEAGVVDSPVSDPASGLMNKNSPDGQKNLRIVPLSETHKPMQDKDLGLEPEAQGSSRPARPKMRIPSLDQLDPPALNQSAGYSPEQLEHMSRLLEAKLKDFNVVAEVVEVNPGPVITRFEIQPAPGVKASKITNLAKDLARSMAVSSVRVVEVIAGKSVMGIEIPNEERQTVSLSEVLNSKPYLEASSKLTLGLGNDIAGNPVVANLAKMPHLLVAGTTGSGKSVGVNAMLLSLLFKATPDEVRLMMVDPKMLELSIYDGIPHLLTPVITDMKDAAAGLRWCVGEMEERYRLMAKMGVRNIAGFNDKIEKARKEGNPLTDPLWNPEEYGMPADSPAPELKPLPYIVVVVDEFADMMMIVGKKVEELIARIAQKARAAGIHLILATQRPSVDVITGLIKANIPTRIAFQVSSKIDSRTILDQAGAEHLLGWGDMLYLPAGTSIPNRVHGAFVSDDEVHRVVEAWKKVGPPNFVDEILNADSGDSVITGSGGLFDDEQDPLYDEAVAFVTETRKASISSVQRKLKIGYNRSARMIEAMEAAGVVSSAGSNGQREVLAPPPVRD
ncbi:DNA translocase FtsK 4TM domain-containing protein [Pontibacterium granulatum]|uniref:DNA translocase FtsK n=1 Tax=Pontibacterium granulatum TaxID=2036029 RepID=UPI00249A58FD|nr:DNA translocase FtsK [Pontibacterium granulatum]MDI3324932.1 DNA translocase FtsK 4TM domain-containing protein [Pontibacterium granulatum]